MKEELLHYIWQSKRLQTGPLYAVDGSLITIIHPGTYNRDAGPDFFNARIQIGKVLWAGNVEMHLQSSDWDAHKHQNNPAYDTVILHVVYHHDKEIRNSKGQVIPVVELKALLPPHVIKRYEHLLRNEQKIPCQPLFALPDEVKVQAWLARLLAERMQEKTQRLQTLLNLYQQNWEEAFYIFNARYFGMKTNAEPFEWLARSIPLRVVGRYQSAPFQLRALLYGVAGLTQHKQYQHLHAYHEEALHLCKKHELKPLPLSAWKYAQTRPANFPHVRIEQWAYHIEQSAHLFSRMLQAETLAEAIALYTTGEAPGKGSIEVLLINSVIPALFLYGKTQADDRYTQRAIDFLDQLPAEKHATTRMWNSLGIKTKSAAESQALLQLKNAYCNHIQCVHCAIGHHILWH